MRFVHPLLHVALLSICLPIASYAETVEKSHLRRLQPNSIPGRPMDCLLLEMHELPLEGMPAVDHDDHFPWYCQDEDYLIFQVRGLSREFFEKRGASSGDSVLRANEAVKSLGVSKGDNIRVNREAGVKIIPRRNTPFSEGGRRLARTGAKSVIVFRAIPPDASCFRDRVAMSDDIFGVAGDPRNLVERYNACSGGKLTFGPAPQFLGQGQIASISYADGVLDIPIVENVTGVARTTAHNYVITKATSLLNEIGLTLAAWDYRMVVLPRAVDFAGAAAYAYVNSQLSVYRDDYYYRVMVLTHEVGHNIGLLHSGFGTAGYADHSCMMGNPNYGDDTPVQCFNGAKSHFLGWYADRHLDISGTFSHDVKVSGIDDYLNGQTQQNEHFVVIKVDNPSSTSDLYIMYNRKEGVNAGVDEHGNKVTIIEAVNNDRSRQSWLEGSLAAGDSYRYVAFSGVYDLVVEVCSLEAGTPDYAHVLIYLDDGLSNKSCPCQSAADCDPQDCMTATCNADNGQCEYAPIGGCCTADSDCLDQSCSTKSCNIATNQCNYTPVADCCTSESDCADLNCSNKSCNATTSTCEYTDIPGCCTTDNECLDQSCSTKSCNMATNQCDYTPVADCCTSEADCADLSCSNKSCNAMTSTCEYTGIPGCCTSEADCVDESCSNKSCNEVTSTCEYTDIPGCCTSEADCADVTCANKSCNALNSMCEYSPIADCCTTDSDCINSACFGNIGTCVDNVCEYDEFCCGNNICEVGENCTTCSSDCTSGSGTVPAVCGNGVCEEEENCEGCPQDCNGVINGNPNNRFCCYGGLSNTVVGTNNNGIDCSDPLCNSGSYSCPLSNSVDFCCGDSICTSYFEDLSNCAVDCL